MIFSWPLWPHQPTSNISNQQPSIIEPHLPRLSTLSWSTLGNGDLEGMCFLDASFFGARFPNAWVFESSKWNGVTRMKWKERKWKWNERKGSHMKWMMVFWWCFFVFGFFIIVSCLGIYGIHCGWFGLLKINIIPSQAVWLEWFLLGVELVISFAWGTWLKINITTTIGSLGRALLRISSTTGLSTHHCRNSIHTASISIPANRRASLG